MGPLRTFLHSVTVEPSRPAWPTSALRISIFICDGFHPVNTVQSGFSVPFFVYLENVHSVSLYSSTTVRVRKYFYRHSVKFKNAAEFRTYLWINIIGRNRAWTLPIGGKARVLQTDQPQEFVVKLRATDAPPVARSTRVHWITRTVLLTQAHWGPTKGRIKDGSQVNLMYLCHKNGEICEVASRN